MDRYPKSVKNSVRIPYNIFKIKIEEDKYKLERKKFSKIVDSKT
jgi:hypothetical protein